MKNLLFISIMFVYTLTSEVTIGQLRFTSLNSVEIESSLTELTDRATIKIPRNWELKDRLIADYIGEGQTVEIKLGYNGQNETEFKGYVSKIKTGIPLTIECEDEMFKLKQLVDNKSWKKVSLSELADYIAPDHQKQLVDPSMDLGRFEIINSTGAQVLEYLKKYGLYSYFTGETLKIGLLSGLTGDHVRHSYHQWNIKSDKGLAFRSKDQQRFKVRALANNRNGKKLKAEYGEADGDLRAFNYIEKTQDELTLLAKDEHGKLKKDRCTGNLKGFGLPRTKAGDIAEINTTANPDIKGAFLIEAVQISFGNGFERTNKLSVRLS